MRRMMLAAGLGTLGLTLPAAAAEFAPPTGCETFLTVQSKDCGVSLLWRCDMAPDGDFWAAAFGPEGLESIVGYSASYQWLDAVYMWDSSREAFLPPATDPIDIDALLGEGVDTYDFAMHRVEPSSSRDVRVLGADQLTGETVVIDGHTLESVTTDLRILGPDGAVEYQSRGTQYLSRELRQFFLGPETVTDPDGTETQYDGSPIDIILPGEPGFGATTPLYDCTKQDAGFAPAPTRDGLKETTDDQI